MAPVGNKSKSKSREHRQSRSRNTTPSSMGASTGTGQTTMNLTSFLEMPLSQLMVPTNLTYDDILERHGLTSAIPDAKSLDSLATDLQTLARLADNRGQACDRGIELSKKKKERLEQEREKEREERALEERHEQLRKEAAVKAEDAASKERKAGPKVKKGKDGSNNSSRESRPLNFGAHGLARQDGFDPGSKGT